MLSSLAAATGAVARRAEQTPIASPSATNSARVFGAQELGGSASCSRSAASCGGRAGRRRISRRH